MDAILKLQLDRVRTRLRHLVVRTASRLVDSEGRLSDRFVARAELVEYLEGRAGNSAADPAATGELQRVFTADSAAAEAASALLLSGGTSPWLELSAAFRLDPLAELVVLAVLAPELDPWCARAYTHAWADFTRKVADVSFVCELLAPDDPSGALVRGLLHPRGPLASSGLVLVGPPLHPDEPVSQLRARVAARVVEVVSGGGAPVEPWWGRAARLIAGNPVEPLLPPATLASFSQVMSQLRPPQDGGAPVVLVGPDGSGRQTLAQWWCARAGVPVVLARLDEAPTPVELFERFCDDTRREALIAGAVIVWRGRASGDGPLGLDAPRLRRLVEAVDRSGAPVVVVSHPTERFWLEQWPASVQLTLPFPTAAVQQALWERFLPPDIPLGRGVALPDLVRRYALSGGSIQKACLELEAQCRSMPEAERRISSELIYRTVRRQLSHRLGELAEPISSAHGWDDLILPAESLDQLRQLISFFRNRNKILNEWGFAGKVLYGRGLSALLSGPPGTGKTMSAAIIARELGMEIYRVDLSRIVDKYIGETEKNLSRVFEEAERAQAVLLFDEADSLFSKRTEVRTSTDRYSNLEINFLLQRVESYDGVTILTTNNESNIDDAFKRRIRYRITFPFPDVAERERLWESMIPSEVKLGNDVDFRQLAEDFEMAGGHIKNALLRSAIFAADEGDTLTFDHLLRGASWEYQEMGKLVRTYG
jgi:AAA+ superfamily predicted ATPase